MNRTAAALVTGLTIASGSAAQPVSEAHILAPSDPADYLQFGDEVDLHDGLAIVGGFGLWTAPLAGAAYLFDAETGAQLAKLDTPALEGPDQILYGVAAGPGRAMVATRNWASTGTYNPRAWLFDTTDPSSPVFIAHIQPSDATMSDDFGDAMDIDGSVAFVAATSGTGVSGFTGAAYLFDTAAGTELAKLFASDGEPGDQFGFSLEIMGPLAILGARFDDELAVKSGSAYIFDVSDPANPVQRSKLTAPDGGFEDYFGWSVTIEGNLAAVGAIFDDDMGHDSGAVYVYDITDPASPILAHKLHPADANPSDDFGWSVAIEGTTLLACSRTDDDLFPGAGSAYLFDLTDPYNPVQLAKIVPSDTSANATFGWSCVLDGAVALIGSNGADASGENRGQAYVFEINTEPPCPADTNNDGSLTPADFTAWIAAFNAGAPACDQNGDSSCTPADFTAWIANFNAGC